MTLLIRLPLPPLLQAVARIFRIGQTQRCFVYRMLYENTTEHHIYHRTLGKESLFSTVTPPPPPLLAAAPA